MLPRLHLVTDDAVLADPGFLPSAEAVLEACGPAVALHLRGHGTRASLRHALGVELAAAALRTGAWLLVNDRVDIAMAVRANGVQLGVASLPIVEARALLGAGACIGYSAHAAAEAVEAGAGGADLVVAGTIYGSRSHPGREPAGVRLIEECAARAGVPVVAIGGVTPGRVAELAGAGAYGVAVLGGVWLADVPAAAAVDYVDALRSAIPQAQEHES